jgi:hypothetical protein
MEFHAEVVNQRAPTTLPRGMTGLKATSARAGLVGRDALHEATDVGLIQDGGLLAIVHETRLRETDEAKGDGI